MTDERAPDARAAGGRGAHDARNVRAYQTRGLLQPPRREPAATSVYGAEHVERLLQVQQARSRGVPPCGCCGRSSPRAATWTACGTAAGRSGPSRGRGPTGWSTSATPPWQRPTPRTAWAAAGCPLAPLLASSGRRTSTDAARAPLPGRVPGSSPRGGGPRRRRRAAPPAAVRLRGALGCASGARRGGARHGRRHGRRGHGSGTDRGRPLGGRTCGGRPPRGVDDDRREAAAARIGELAGALVEQLVTGVGRRARSSEPVSAVRRRPRPRPASPAAAPRRRRRCGRAGRPRRAPRPSSSLAPLTTPAGR